MNCGFSNLATLKKHLLADGLTGSVQFDDVIAAIGLGVAGTIEQFCQRKFGYSAAHVQSFGADRVQFILSNTPLLSVSKTEFKQDEATGFVEQDSTFIRTIDNDNGIIYLPDQSDPGAYWSLVRFTYAGGYWWETAEPDDDVFPTPQTDGVSALPDDVRLAWLIQCKQLWSKQDKLGLGMIDKPDEQSKLNDELKLTPLVKQLLTNYVKLNLT